MFAMLNAITETYCIIMLYCFKYYSFCNILIVRSNEHTVEFWLEIKSLSLSLLLVNNINPSSYTAQATRESDKVSMLIHTYPHKPLKKWPFVITRLTTMLHISWCFTYWFANIEPCMIIHNTECPYSDPPSVNNLTSSSYKGKLSIIHSHLQQNHRLPPITLCTANEYCSWLRHYPFSLHRITKS